MGDPNKLILLREVIKIIEKDDLVTNTFNMGNNLRDGLRDLEVSLIGKGMSAAYHTNFL
jgi:4-aminobutyrate aminotransferase-like enzyme